MKKAILNLARLENESVISTSASGCGVNLSTYPYLIQSTATQPTGQTGYYTFSIKDENNFEYESGNWKNNTGTYFYAGKHDTEDGKWYHIGNSDDPLYDIVECKDPSSHTLPPH